LNEFLRVPNCPLAEAERIKLTRDCVLRLKADIQSGISGQHNGLEEGEAGAADAESLTLIQEVVERRF
jgi:hypothetical protein